MPGDVSYFSDLSEFCYTERRLPTQIEQYSSHMYVFLRHRADDRKGLAASCSFDEAVAIN